MAMIKRIALGLAIVLTGIGAVFAATGQATTGPTQPEIIKYQFTYNHSHTLIFVTTQDINFHIEGFPCSPPAVARSGNYSISCDLPR